MSLNWKWSFPASVQIDQTWWKNFIKFMRYLDELEKRNQNNVVLLK